MPTPIDPPFAAEHAPVLIICTRDPRGNSSGRKMVLQTIITSLCKLGHPVTVAHFGSPEAAAVLDAVQYVALPSPSRLQQLGSAIRWFIGGSISLNEGLYQSHHTLGMLKHIAQQAGAKIVVTDMLRTAFYGANLNLPWIADLDDLLSRRYRAMASDYSEQSNVLGYSGSALSRVLVRLLQPLMPWVLRREALIIERREIDVARQANLTTLVNAEEARTLTELSGHQVFHTPMAVPGPTILPRNHNRPRELVFLGGLNYGPNLKSVVQFDSEIRPALEQANIFDLTLHVIGNPGIASEYSFSDAVVLEGYLDDLDHAMQQYKAMLVPRVLPGGVKTKIVVAARNGTIVLAHSTALEGMGLQDRHHILAWETEDELQKLLVGLRQGSFDLGRIGQAAHAWAVDNFSPEHLCNLWRQNIAKVI